jgi:hypothetical protein
MDREVLASKQRVLGNIGSRPTSCVTLRDSLPTKDTWMRLTNYSVQLWKLTGERWEPLVENQIVDFGFILLSGHLSFIAQRECAKR